MKHFSFYCSFLLISTSLFSQFQPLDRESRIAFTIKNLGFTVTGAFSGIKGTILFDPQNLPGSSINVSVDAASVNTDNSMRDDHLRGETYFDVKRYPKISFVSTNITALRNRSFLVTGKLTIKNISKEISIPFTVKQVPGGFAFVGSFSINRRDFDVGGTSIISDMLIVDLTVLATK